MGTKEIILLLVMFLFMMGFMAAILSFFFGIDKLQDKIMKEQELEEQKRQELEQNKEEE
ncbi:MAG: hypothetical protein QNL04_15735 [SAR324 cluster bacterium]|nr:hypothetical protein [SAR324 cluster bacterium]